MTQLLSAAMFRTGLITLVVWLGATGYAEAATEVGFSTVGAREMQITAKLYRPAGSGPFPAVTLLHDCSGILPMHHWWAETLQKWGYVVLLVDSLGPRGVSETCTDPLRVNPYDRRFDAYGALFYLQNLPFVVPNKVGIIGWGHGGWTVRKVARKPWLNVLDLPHGGFSAAIAFYPNCGSKWPFYPPFLILIGEKDDWTPAGSCIRLVRELSAESAPVTLKVYPEAYHWFDSLKPLDVYLGHKVGRHAESAAKATKEVRQFLAQHLKTK